MQYFETSSFKVQYENLGNDVYSIFFSEGNTDYINILPNCIYEKSIDECNDSEYKNNNGWRSSKIAQTGLFCLFNLELVKRFPFLNDEYWHCCFNIVTFKNRIIHTRLLHSPWSSEKLKICSYSNCSNSIVIISDCSESKIFMDSLGVILLKTDGIPEFNYENIRYYSKSDMERIMPYDLVVSPHFVLARIKDKWEFFNKELTKIKVWDELLNLKITSSTGFLQSESEYVILNLFPQNQGPNYPTNVIKSIVVYKDGSQIFSRDNEFIDDIIKYEECIDIWFATTRDMMTIEHQIPVFKKNKYLFTLKGRYRELFNNNDKLAVFYNETESSYRYGVTNRNLDMVIPPIFEDAHIIKGSFIKFKLNGKVGIWNESLESIVPHKFTDILCIKSFFIGILECDDKGCKEYHILKNNGEKSWHEVFNDVYCNFFNRRIISRGIIYNAEISLCTVTTGNVIKFGIISSNGNFIIPPIYEYLEIIYENESKDNINPKVVKYAESVELVNTSRNKYEYQVKSGRFGFLSLDGTVVIPALYDAVTVYGDYIRVRKDDKFGLYTLNGKVLLDVVYTAINFIAIKGITSMAVYNINGIVKGLLSDYDKCYAIGLNDFSSYGPNQGGYINRKITIEGGYWGYYNLKNQFRGEALYTEVHPFDKGFAIVKLENSYYLLNYKLEICKGPYDSIRCGKYYSKNYNYSEDVCDDIYGGSEYGYSRDELDHMYNEAFESEQESEWNIN